MHNMTFQMDPSALFGSLMVILAPYVWHLVNIVTRTVADLGVGNLCMYGRGYVSPPKGEKGDSLRSPAPKCGLTC